MPGQAGAAVQQRGLVGLDDQQVVGLLGHEDLGRLGVGLQRVGGDHHTGQVQAGQQRPEPGNLARGAVDVGLGPARCGSRGPYRPAGGPAGPGTASPAQLAGWQEPASQTAGTLDATGCRPWRPGPDSTSQEPGLEAPSQCCPPS
jgi:hypothetical protein